MVFRLPRSRCAVTGRKATPVGMLILKELGPHVIMDDATAGFLQTEQARELIDAVNEQLGSETIQFYPGRDTATSWSGSEERYRSVCVDPQQVVGARWPTVSRAATGRTSCGG